MKRSVVITALLLAVASAATYLWGINQNWFGEPLHAGKIAEGSVAKQLVIAERVSGQRASIADVGAAEDKQILFGDLHVHTSFSMDAYLSSLPIMQGEGVHPPADACDFARYCSALDFWSINDHAESITAERWLETKDTIRQCNAVAGDQSNPDTVAFLGWEWTQVGNKPKNNFGHKNIVLLDTAEEKVPARPIAAMGAPLMGMQKAKTGAKKFLLPALDFANRQEYYNFERYIRDSKTPLCPKGVDVHDLPVDCMEYTDTAAELFEKLHQWGFPNIVIPHGNTVGHHTPQQSTWMNQLTSGNHDPELQTMIEIYSGHGNSEEFRDWENVALDDNGAYYCPGPTEDYTPMCWQAGEVIRKRCLSEGSAAGTCDDRAKLARHYSVKAGHKGFSVVGGSEVEEWGDAGECRDCFLPTSGLFPMTSAQAALAVRNFKAGAGESDRFKFALMASSDTHTARAGTGFKEIGRHNAADVSGPKSEWLSRIMNNMGDPLTSPVALDPHVEGMARFTERSRSFTYTGGLIATHASGRDRQSIWDALQRKEIYGTSGPRILLWFNLLNSDAGEVPMGADLTMNRMPKFQVRALGAFKQKPGCPDYAIQGLSSERLEGLCYGECYNPDDERYRIERIEVVKITPQNSPEEPLSQLIDDSWKTFECNDLGQGCVVEFEDADFSSLARDSLYYVRAIQEATPTINGANLRCEYDESGQCIKVNPCYINGRTDYSDDCLSPAEHRAWSSPIFVDYRMIE